MSKSIREISALGILTALYVGLCIVSWPLAYTPLQFRIAETLIVLPFYNKKYSIAIVLGTFIANLIGPYGIVDAVVGSFASALVCLIIIALRSKLVIAPAAGIINGIIIGAMINIIVGISDPAAGLATMASVAFFVFIVVLIGVAGFTAIEKKNPAFVNMLRKMNFSKSASQKV